MFHKLSILLKRLILHVYFWSQILYNIIQRKTYCKKRNQNKYLII